MSFREIWNGPSFLNRSEVAQRMTARDNAGKEKNWENQEETLRGTFR